MTTKQSDTAALTEEQLDWAAAEKPAGMTQGHAMWTEGHTCEPHL